MSEMTVNRDDLLDAYLRGKAAGREEAARGDVYDQETDGAELHVHELLERFDQAGPSDVLRLGELQPSEVLQTLLGALERDQFVFRVTHPDGWVANILTTHGTAAVAGGSDGGVSFNITYPPIHKGTLDIGRQVQITQARHVEEGKGWRTVTGAQYGRWYL